ncbi:serine/threonine-protein kinase [Hyalangium sp.]|uniref:serine/threonine-protein kinase n=1 Tax=Hyalangium sp. TaxID=2028555 RepID=UPI002D344096|nr:serine/threonine-protein kinase [Hyalangium sp.]HYI01571.1 serine/threonine-protein kinase [Hyalangium sp.]
MPSDVGDYSIVRRVAVGATSEIYEGRHKASGDPVAIKVLRPEWCLHIEVVARFVNEAQALQGMKHPHLVRALASGLLPQGAPFMILDWLPVDLHQVLTKAGGRLPVEACAQVILQLAGALDALHEHSLIHRDLKPANVLLARWETGAIAVKLADLGLAKNTAAGGPEPSALPVSTAGSALLGTWDYMAPEQWVHSKTAGPMADVYSLGVLWFQMLVGRLPFVAEEGQDLMYQHLWKRPPLELLGDQVPGPTQVLVARMLSKKVTKRPTPREIQELLSATGG